MKKISILLFLYSLTLISFSQQKLELTPKGFVVANDPDANFLVYDRNGTQQELFNSVLSYMNSVFVSPKDVLSFSDPEVITVNGVVNKDVYVKKAWGGLPLSINYTIVFYFKDNKIRVNFPTINRMQVLPSNGAYPVTINNGDDYIVNGADRLYIFSKKGELKNKMGKDDIEMFFNTFIDQAVNYVNPTKEKW